MNNIKPIRTKRDYKAALKRIESLMETTKKNEIDELEILAILAAAYEEKRAPIKEYPTIEIELDPELKKNIVDNGIIEPAVWVITPYGIEILKKHIKKKAKKTKKT